MLDDFLYLGRINSRGYSHISIAIYQCTIHSATIPSLTIVEIWHDGLLANRTTFRPAVRSVFGTVFVYCTLVAYIVTTGTVKCLLGVILSIDSVFTFVTDVVLTGALNVWGIIDDGSAVTANLSEGTYRSEKYFALRLPRCRAQCFLRFCSGGIIAPSFTRIQDYLLNCFNLSSSATWILGSSQRYCLQCQTKIVQAFWILSTQWF